MLGICLKDFSIAFGNTQILENVSFDVKDGEIVTILGASGSGKSTILRSISSLEDKYKGDIYLHTCYLKKNQNSCATQDIGYIFQDYALFPHLNVLQNITFALKDLSKKEKEIQADKLLELFDLEEHKYKQIHELSGGQQQRVSIARVIAYKPKVLLLDEPFSNLDSILRNKTKIWLKGIIKEFGFSAILVTHDKKEALSISDKIAIIQNKTIVQFGTPKELFSNPVNKYVANFLGDINELPKEILKDFDLKNKNNDDLIIRVNKTFLTKKKNEHKLRLLDISYCGDYYELSLEFTKYNNYVIIINVEDLNGYTKESELYLDIKKENLILIKP
ncbi:MAG: ABC transporter ATP-binding protein [Campylobacteraceae bacterium]|nr:ABC transporter ATP-binding protein [Campylobacteraceae bacterium]